MTDEKPIVWIRLRNAKKMHLVLRVGWRRYNKDDEWQKRIVVACGHGDSTIHHVDEWTTEKSLDKFPNSACKTCQKRAGKRRDEEGLEHLLEPLTRPRPNDDDDRKWA